MASFLLVTEPHFPSRFLALADAIRNPSVRRRLGT